MLFALKIGPNNNDNNIVCCNCLNFNKAICRPDVG